MNKIFFACMLITIGNNMSLLATTTHEKKQKTTAFYTLVGSDIYPNHYWHALVAIAKNKHDLAKRIIAQEDTSTHDDTQPTSPIENIFDQIFITLVAHDPQLLSFLKLFEVINVGTHNMHLTNFSPQEFLDTTQRKKECLKLLYQYPIETLSEEEQVSYKIFEYLLTRAVIGEKFLFHDYYVNHIHGLLFELITTFTEYHQLKTPEDAQHYCTRLAAIPEQCKQIKALQEHQKNLGITPPAFCLQRVIQLLANMTPPSIDDAILYKHFAQTIKKIPQLDEQTLLDQAQATMTNSVYPALQELHLYYLSLLETQTTDHGAWALPNGDEYYSYMLARHTTSSLSADEIHDLGLQEVDRIQKEMRALFVTMNRNDETKSASQLMQELEQCSEFYYPSTAEGQQACLDDYVKILERCRKELYPLFDHKPKQSVVIQKVPEYLQDSSPGAYYLPPSIDGSRPGTFFANLRNMEEVPRYRMETLAVHEAEPGHHFQFAIQNELNIPPARKLGDYNAYAEGWALYTEKLAYEHGFYSSPANQLGHFQDELMRAARLVVDTGIHKKRWSKEQAIQYMMDILGWHYDAILTEVERYFVWPGQACSYKVGQLKILALRDKAKKELGAAFDIREFHNVVLDIGISPLFVLEDVVDQFINKKLALKSK